VALSTTLLPIFNFYVPSLTDRSNVTLHKNPRPCLPKKPLLVVEHDYLPDS
jgi:hypothetical protein